MWDSQQYHTGKKINGGWEGSTLLEQWSTPSGKVEKWDWGSVLDNLHAKKPCQHIVIFNILYFPGKISKYDPPPPPRKNLTLLEEKFNFYSEYSSDHVCPIHKCPVLPCAFFSQSMQDDHSPSFWFVRIVPYYRQSRQGRTGHSIMHWPTCFQCLCAKRMELATIVYSALTNSCNVQT